MIKINKKRITILGKDERLEIYLNSNLTFKERRNALKVKNVEQCKQLVLEVLWKMKLKEFPLNIWNEIQPCICKSRNFIIIYKKEDIISSNDSFTFSAPEIYLNKIK